MQVKDKILISMFLWMFSVYIIGLDYNINSLYNNILFWIPILSMMIILFYQIFNFNKSKKEYMILAELFLFYLCLHLIYQVGFYGLGSSDAYIDYNFFKSILATSHFSLGGEISGWPILHIFASEMTYFTNLGSLEIAKYLPSIISSLIVLPLYILANSVYDNKKVALIACLIFGTISQFIEFESYFVREIIGVFFIVLLFYIIYIYKKNPTKSRPFTLLFFLIVPVLVLSHHFSSFLFLIIITLFLLMSYVVPLIYKRKNSDLKTKINVNTVFLVCSVILLAYWIYSATMVLENLGVFFKGLFGITEVTSYVQQAQLTGSIVSLRGTIIYYGFFIFNIILGAILMLKLFIDNNKENIEDFTFTFFLLFCGIYGLMAVFFISTSIFPQRLLTFGWILGVIPLAGFILTLNRMNHENLKLFQISFKRLTKPKIGNYKIINIAFVLLIFSFMTFNLYNIDPDYIGKDYSAAGVADYDAYAIADIIKFNSTYALNNSPFYYYGYSGATNAIFDEHGIPQQTVGKDISKIKYYDTNFPNSNKIAIINENIILQYLDYQKIKSIQDYNDNMLILSYKNSTNVNKIVDIGNNIYVLKGTGNQ